MTIQRTLLVLIAAVLGIRLAFIVLRPLEVTDATPGDERYYRHIALRLLDAGEYGEYGTRAYRPPGYPAFVAAVFAVTKGSGRWLQLVQHLMLLVAAAVVAVAASRIAGRTAGLICFLLAAADPVWLSIPQHMLSETLFTLLVAGAALLVGQRPERGPTIAVAVAVGLLAGASTLVREVGLLVIAVATAVLTSRAFASDRLRRCVVVGVAVVLSAAVVVVPWTIRNAVVLGAFVPISTGSNLNLYIGNNPKANGSFRWAIPGEAGDFERDEVGFSRRLARSAYDYAVANPRRTLRLAPVKVWCLWRPMWPGPSSTGIDRWFQISMALYWPPLCLLGLYGMWIERRHPLTWLLLGLASLASVAHIATFGLDRFRTPWQFLWTILAAVALVALTGRRSGGAARGDQRVRADMQAR